MLTLSLLATIKIPHVPSGTSLGAALAMWVGISVVAMFCALLLLWGNEMDRAQ